MAHLHLPSSLHSLPPPIKKRRERERDQIMDGRDQKMAGIFKIFLPVHSNSEGDNLKGMIFPFGKLQPLTQLLLYDS